MARFTDKVAIVTGSSFGIGRATALLFAKDGAKVTVTGRNEQKLEDSRKELLAAGIPAENVLVVAADVTTAQGQDQLIAQTLQKFGKVDILVNNAGAAIPDVQGRPGLHQGIDTYQKILELNVQSVIELTQKIRPHLAKTKGEIVNVSSIAACPIASVSHPYYAVAKAGLNQYSRSAAVDMIQDGIRVNIVSPGLVATGFAEAAGMADSSRAEKFYTETAKFPECIPSGKCGTPHDIASVIAFLADREASSYIVGQNIIADGGTSLVLGLHASQMIRSRSAAPAAEKKKKVPLRKKYVDRSTTTSSSSADLVVPKLRRASKERNNNKK